jgi:hypothetical protein
MVNDEELIPPLLPFYNKIPVAMHPVFLFIFHEPCSGAAPLHQLNFMKAIPK